jgi:hypothetical protein
MVDKKDEKSHRFNWNILLYGGLFLAALGAIGDRVEIAVPIAGMAMIVAPFWFWYRRKMRRDELELQAKTAIANPENDAQFKRMQERVENLEAMMCNLDREINLQMEKSLRVTNMLASISNPAGVSQMHGADRPPGVGNDRGPCIALQR